MIGSIVKQPDGTYAVGAIPGIGGPFETAADFFCAWAKSAKFPYSEAFIRKRTQSQNVDLEALITSIRDFPTRLSHFAKQHRFRSGPFPLLHTDFYKSNVLIDSEYRIQGVIDWDNAMVGPWEMVEFPKDLCIVPPVLDGLLYRESEESRAVLADRDRYVEVVKALEEAKQVDGELSSILGDERVQSLAQGVWLYLDGRIGFYSDIFDLFLKAEG